MVDKPSDPAPSSGDTDDHAPDSGEGAADASAEAPPSNPGEGGSGESGSGESGSGDGGSGESGGGEGDDDSAAADSDAAGDSAEDGPADDSPEADGGADDDATEAADDRAETDRDRDGDGEGGGDGGDGGDDDGDGDGGGDSEYDDGPIVETDGELPRRKPGRLRRIALMVLALLVVAGIAVYVATRRDPLVTRPATAPSRVLIRNVMVIDVVGGQARPGMDVLLDGATITSIAPHSPTAKPAAGTAVIDGSGKSLIPGLIDAHCHLSNQGAPRWVTKLPDVDLNLERLLYSGVTRVFDPGAPAPDTFELRGEIAAGKRLGPTLYAAGPMFTTPGGHPIPLLRDTVPSLLVDRITEAMVREVSNEAEARAAIEALHAHSPDFLKVAVDRLPLNAPRLDAATVAIIVREAKARGIRAVAHIGTTQDAIDAGNAGVSAWIHGVYKERIADEDIAKLAAFKIPMAPTLVVFRTYAEVGRGNFPSTQLEREVMEEALLDARDTVPDDFEIKPELARFIMLIYEQRKNGLENVRRLNEAGVVIMAGSDAQPAVLHGPALHRELALLSKAGLSNLDTLRAATLHPARFFANQDDPPFGIVAVGKQADLVLVRGNPLESVEAISAIDQVFLQGVPLERHALEP